MNKCNKTSAFSISKQYYTKFSFIFIIHSNKNSLSVPTIEVVLPLWKLSNHHKQRQNWRFPLFLKDKNNEKSNLVVYSIKKFG